MIQLNDKIIGYDSDNREKFNSNTIKAGIQMTFANGNTISIQFGFGNYCKNKNQSKDNCKDAEIAIWNAANEWHNFEGDQVKGYCNADEVAKWIHFAANNTF
jgi:hypothetical protein